MRKNLTPRPPSRNGKREKCLVPLPVSGRGWGGVLARDPLHELVRAQSAVWVGSAREDREDGSHLLVTGRQQELAVAAIALRPQDVVIGFGGLDGGRNTGRPPVL